VQKHHFGRGWRAGKAALENVGRGLDWAAVFSTTTRFCHRSRSAGACGAIPCSDLKARVTVDCDSFSKRLSFNCKSTWRTAGTLARAADCVECWVHEFEGKSARASPWYPTRETPSILDKPSDRRSPFDIGSSHLERTRSRTASRPMVPAGYRFRNRLDRARSDCTVGPNQRSTRSREINSEAELLLTV
jgi:hypothetical protein